MIAHNKKLSETAVRDPFEFQYSAVAALNEGSVAIICRSEQELRHFWAELMNLPIQMHLVQKVEIRPRGHDAKVVVPALEALRGCLALLDGPLAGMEAGEAAAKKARKAIANYEKTLAQ